MELCVVCECVLVRDVCVCVCVLSHFSTPHLALFPHELCTCLHSVDAKKIMHIILNIIITGSSD